MRPRDKSVLEFWDRKEKLSVKNREYKSFIRDFFNFMLKYDIKNKDLTTSSLIEKSKTISAVIIAKESGIIAGLEEFRFLNRDLRLKFMKKDGDRAGKNESVVKITGNAKKILERERINLNLLQRMSGIATLADDLNKKSKKIKIAATRKTLWGLLDKKAVSIGGGLTHRLNLNDGILIKENHLKLVEYNFTKVIDDSKLKSKYVEIEVENKKQALMAADAIKKYIKKNNGSLFAIMLDNINPKKIKSVVNELKKRNLYESVLVEASGNINEKNIKKYSNCGAEMISMGCLTNSAKILNMSQEIL